MMRIGIDAHHINGKPQGSRTYLIHLIRALSKLAKHEPLRVYSYRPEQTDRVLGVDNLKHARVFPRSAKWRLTLVLPAIQMLDRVDVFHSQYIAPPLSSTAEVVSIHDILFETHPKLFEGAFSNASVWLIRRSAKRARRVLTGSVFSRDALIERYGLSEDKIVVAPDGVDLERFQPISNSNDLANLRHRYDLTSPFVLCVGRLEPRKNLVHLMECFDRMRRRVDRQCQLILVGPKDFRHEEILDAMAGYPEGTVRWLGAVPDEDLPALYNLAEALAYPSLVEGFGMPVLEALACGTPVVSARRGALPEVAGEAALWVDPEDTDALSGALQRILEDTELRSELRSAGLARARRFSWQQCAQKTWEAYAAAAGS